jgi:hypothetical protein
MRTMRRNWIADGLLAASSLGAVGLGLLLIDDRVHDEVSRWIAQGRPSGRLVFAGAEARDFLMQLAEAARDQAMAYTPLTVFALAALLLFIVMMRV